MTEERICLVCGVRSPLFTRHCDGCGSVFTATVAGDIGAAAARALDKAFEEAFLRILRGHKVTE